MGKTKEKQVSVDVLRPYVQRALSDPELRDDLVAAFVAARDIYSQISKERGVTGKAAKVSEKDFQKDIQGLVTELTDASDRLQGKARKSHKTRNRVLLLTGVTLGVLYNPWTGQATRDWIMNRVAGGDGEGLEELEADLAAEAPAGGNGGPN